MSSLSDQPVVRAIKTPKGAFAGAWIALVIFCAVFAPLLTPYDYDIQNLPGAFAPPSATNLLGTDEFGRDLLTRIFYGARTSLSVSSIAIGISVFLQEFVRLFYGRVPFLDFPDAKQKVPFPQIDVVTGKAFEIGNVTIQRSAIFTVGALIMCAAALWYFVNRTKMGRGMQAVSQDPDTARLMGINVDRVIVVAFAIGATLAAIAGVAQGLQVTNINFKMGFLAGLKAFTAAVLGGIGNVWGAVVGGVTLGIVEAMAVQFIPGTFGGSPWKDVWAFALLIIVLVFRPQGLLGAKVVDRA